MPLPDFLSTSNTFRQWLATTNNLISHVDNTSVYILVSQNATPRVATGNISVNGTITLGATTLNTTAYTGTATNATNLNSQPGSFYTNASNLDAGTLAIARLDANVLLTTSTTGINASALSTGTVPLARLASANSSANGVVDTTTQTFAGNKTFDNNVAIIGYLTVGNNTITMNSTTMIVGNATANMVLHSAGISMDGLPKLNSTALIVGNATSNMVLHSAGITMDGVSIVDASGAANNATYFDGQPAGYYTNASNLTAGTLAIARLDANVLLTSSSTGINASALSTGTVSNDRLSGTYTNITANNATYAFGKSEGALNVNSATQATNATNLNSQPASYYTNASNLNTGSLAFTRLTTTTAGNLLMGNATGGIEGIAMSGDITISSAGATAIGSSKVTNTMLAGSIAASKISGTAITAADTGTVTSAMIADGTIVNGDISASAAIAVTKLSSSTISGITLGNNLNAATFNNGGAGGASGSTYNGSAALTVSYNTVGAPSTTGTNASGTWGINITGSANDTTYHGGLGIHTGRNNDSNKVVRTDANGYIQAGWINTDSGDSGIDTRLTRIYSSGDSYLRYSTLSDFKVHMGESAKNTYSRRIDYTSDANYHVGSFGHSGYGANETFHGGSGFFDIWNGTNYPSGTSHIHGFNALHYTTSSLGTTGGTAYGIQVAGQYNAGGELWSRGCNAGTFSSWRLQLDSTNYTSYAVRSDYNSTLNSDTRNTYGVTRLFRRDSNSDYSVQTYWTGTYWRLYGYSGDSSHADTHVGYADSAGSASSATNATNATNGRYVYNNGSYGGTTGYIEPSSLYVAYAYLGRVVYNNGAYSGSGWVEPSDLGVRYASSAGNADTVDSLHASSFTRKDTTGQWIRPYYEYGSYLTSETPATLASQMGGGGLRVDFMYPTYTGSGNWNHVITWSGYNYYTMYQLGGNYGGTDTDLWVRSEANHSGTSWTAWRKLLNSSNYSSYALPLSGGTVTGSAYFTASTYPIFVYGNGNTGSASGVGLNIYSTGGNGAIMAFHRGGQYAVNMGLDSDNVFRIGGWSAPANLLTLDMSGNLYAPAITKGTGYFRIRHPLPEKAETHDLVHSFIEGPLADLIYRGTVALVDGTATVNIDTAAGMTEGTFVALCRNVQCFTSNETDWTAVRGSVSGNLLTITAHDSSSSATVSWLVIGERHDPFIMNSSTTDNDGHVIVEPAHQSQIQ